MPSSRHTPEGSPSESPHSAPAPHSYRISPPPAPHIPLHLSLHSSPGVLGNSGNGGKEAGCGRSWTGGCISRRQERVHEEVGQEGLRLGARGEGKPKRESEERTETE